MSPEPGTRCCACSDTRTRRRICSPVFVYLRGHRHYADLLRRMSLPEARTTAFGKSTLCSRLAYAGIQPHAGMRVGCQRHACRGRSRLLPGFRKGAFLGCTKHRGTLSVREVLRAARKRSKRRCCLLAWNLYAHAVNCRSDSRAAREFPQERDVRGPAKCWRGAISHKGRIPGGQVAESHC